MLIRPADLSDADALVAVHLRSRAAAPMPAGVRPEPEVHAWLSARLATDDVWVAEADGEVVGYARITSGWLDDLYVVPERAGEGIGSALLEVVKARQPDGFCLWVFEMNAPARAFYARHGLAELERTDGSANEEGAPDIRMAWPGADPLRFFRDRIDEVDEQLGDLLARRAALTRAVQQLKGDSTRDPERERQITAALAVRAPALGPDRMARIVHAIITESIDAATEI